MIGTTVFKVALLPLGEVGPKWINQFRLGGLQLMRDFISCRDNVPHDTNLKINIDFLCTE